MKALLKVMELVSNVEMFTEEPRYRSTFYWKDENNLLITCYCWKQASAWKNILDEKRGIIVYMENNNVIRVVNTEY